MDYQYFTTFERGRIEELRILGYTVREIGQQIKRHHSTIARELSRNNNVNYCCETAQEAYFYRRKGAKPIGKCSPDLVTNIEKALEATMVSRTDSQYCFAKGKVGFKTIYRWLYSGKVSKGNLKVLRHLLNVKPGFILLLKLPTERHLPWRERSDSCTPFFLKTPLKRLL